MQIAICDDYKMFREQIRAILDEYADTHENIDIDIFAFSNADECLAMSEKYNGFDIYILDILMPGMNGIELGLELRQNGYDGSIIYLTSSEDFAIDSYRTEASNYILKPIVKSDLWKAFEKALVSLENKTDKNILVKTRQEAIRIPLSDIMYAELQKRAIVYYLTNGETVESVTIRVPFASALQELLAQKHFVLCGTSLAFNLHHITSVSSEEIVFKGNHKVFFSKKICRDVRSLWSDYFA